MHAQDDTNDNNHTPLLILTQFLPLNVLLQGSSLLYHVI